MTIEHKPRRETSAFGDQNSIMIKSEIDRMNQRLDAIDNHCKEFAKMA